VLFVCLFVNFFFESEVGEINSRLR